jgi:DNA repair photolyase
MVACFPDQLVALLKQKCPPDETHTVVLWTKNPANLLEHNDLHQTCRKYPLYLHFTITGLGSTQLEPNVPQAGEMLKLLGPLVEYIGNPERIRIRFDPIVHLGSDGGRAYCNLDRFEEIVAEAARHCICNLSTSWMSPYKKVVARLRAHGLVELPLTEEQRQEELRVLLRKAAQYNAALFCCSMPGMPLSRCIDGEMLTALHPERLPCSIRKAKGQRTTCGCTESLDIGWYFKCPHGCIYCYANPTPVPANTYDHTFIAS